ncbi:hypothetical protein FS749_007938 [Ceratobasidium sp. UAMH 11750]|nr:hypothetical protein FS749_007938 [Ceratobasidium sp. UAMH 11750]
MEPDKEPGARERCFCCGKRLGPRQLRRHLHDYLDDIEAEFAAAGDYHGGGDDDDDDDGLLDNAGPAANGDEIGVGDIALEDGAGEMQAFADGQAFEHMDLGPDNDPLPLPPDDALPPLEPGHVHELRRNPPVHIQDWPDPGSDNESEGAGPADEPFNGPDQDPPYNEQAAHQARDELDHLNELNLRDDDVRAALEVQLGDLADEAWMDLYVASTNWTKLPSTSFPHAFAPTSRVRRTTSSDLASVKIMVFQASSSHCAAYAFSLGSKWILTTAALTPAVASSASMSILIFVRSATSHDTLPPATLDARSITPPSSPNSELCTEVLKWSRSSAIGPGPRRNVTLTWSRMFSTANIIASSEANDPTRTATTDSLTTRRTLQSGSRRMDLRFSSAADVGFPPPGRF